MPHPKDRPAVLRHDTIADNAAQSVEIGSRILGLHHRLDRIVVDHRRVADLLLLGNKRLLYVRLLQVLVRVPPVDQPREKLRAAIAVREAGDPVLLGNEFRLPPRRDLKGVLDEAPVDRQPSVVDDLVEVVEVPLPVRDAEPNQLGPKLVQVARSC